MSVDRVLNFELSRLNQGLPQQRISLKDALAADKPGVVTKDGTVSVLMMINPKLGRGAAKVTGEVEARVIAGILQKELSGGELVIYRPEVAEVRRKLPTTTQYSFTMG